MEKLIVVKAMPCRQTNHRRPINFQVLLLHSLRQALFVVEI